MMIKNLEMMVTNNTLKKLQDGTEYASVGILSKQGDGAKYDVSVRDLEMASKLIPFETYSCDLDLQNSKYGLKLVLIAINNKPGNTTQQNK